MSPCLRPKDLPEVASLPADDPRRRHLERCPACRALLHAYQEFISADGLAENPDLDRAEAELAARLEQVADQLVKPRPGSRWRTRGWLAAAAVLVACAGIFLARDLQRLDAERLPTGRGELRGDGPSETLGWAETERGWRLEWDEGPGGTPELVFLDANVVEVGRRSDLPVDIAPDLMPTNAVYLQLVFVADTDTLARSNLLRAQPGSR